jgi:tRNA uridine 5-carboxymethylaminomethyl modification enzyme
MHSASRVWNDFDVIVVGGGHAGIEAAYAAARMGSHTLMITLNVDRIGHMPCNPAIGGIGKGHMVFEISAFGGLMPQLCTKTYLQARMLNTRKGPAVQGLRLQIDKVAYNQLSRQMLAATPNLTIAMGMVDDVIVENNEIKGIRTREGATYYAPTVVLTTGTFLNGLIHVGQTNYSAGRQGEEPSISLATRMKNLNLQMGRLKTGTPPRLVKSSLDFSRMEHQGSDPLEYLFEFIPHKVTPILPCYITHTNTSTHDIIRRNAHLSPIYSGKIKGTAPRYCPSIEDKINRFADKASHHVFVEPESASLEEMYPNGLSTSLPFEAQRDFIRTIVGFEDAVIARPGYAIEYDFVLPHQLHHSLELKALPGLFLAGQINGTTGYEEAAGQGLIAGINAHLKAARKPPFVMKRSQGYIGIMIDDLVTLGVDEPYRMFTSRAERRLILRQDNVFNRLGEIAYNLGLISEERFAAIKKEREIIDSTVQHLQQHHATEIVRLLSAGELDTVYQHITTAAQVPLAHRTLVSIHAELLYEPYLKRENREIQRMEQYQELAIPEDFDYRISGLSIELQQKCTKYRPQTIAQAALIQGMTPAAISLLIFKLRELPSKK